MINVFPPPQAKAPRRLVCFLFSAPSRRALVRQAQYPWGRHAALGASGLLCLGGLGCEQLLRSVETVGQPLSPPRVDAGVPPESIVPAVVPAPQGCSLGEVRCDGELLQECEVTFGGLARQWKLLDQCRSGSTCSTTLGQCTAQACEVGTWQCSEGRLHVCLGSEDWVHRDQCDSQQSCVEGLKQCGTDGGCDAATPPACPRSTCTPGEFQCFGAGILRECSAQQRWLEVEQCANSALCFEGQETGECPEPACEIGSARCVDNRLEVCLSDRSSFQPTVPPCRSDETCDAEQQACIPPSCEPLSFECSGRSLRRCSALGNSLSTTEVCQSADLCNAVLGRCDIPPADAGTPRRQDAAPTD